MIGKEIFELVFDESYKIGFDPYDANSGSYSLGVVTEPKKQFQVRRIGKFLRVVDIGYSHVVKIIK